MLWEWGSASSGGPRRGLSGVVFLPTGLLGSLPEPGESPDLQLLGLAETHLCFSWHSSSGATILTYIQATLPNPASRTHYLQILIEPSSSQVPFPTLGSAVKST